MGMTGGSLPRRLLRFRREIWPSLDERDKNFMRQFIYGRFGPRQLWREAMGYRYGPTLWEFQGKPLLRRCELCGWLLEGYDGVIHLFDQESGLYDICDRHGPGEWVDALTGREVPSSAPRRLFWIQFIANETRWWTLVTVRFIWYCIITLFWNLCMKITLLGVER